jgi:hypothetical protein
VKVLHGTSDIALARILAGSSQADRVYIASNRSLGGAYVTGDPGLARAAAVIAAAAHGGCPVVLALDIAEDDLLPDEDWVVRAAEAPEDVVLGPRVSAFLDDLFRGYPGEGFSLSDHYCGRYAEINRRHRITWRDSWVWGATARLPRLLTASDITARHPVSG